MRVTLGLIGIGVALLAIAAPVMQRAPGAGLIIAIAGLIFLTIVAWRIN